jgi:uncharacterized protein (TIGR03083 family)
MQPRKMSLRTRGRCDFDPGRLLGVFSEQRQRFVAVLEGFGPDEWAAPTRCSAWSAQQVVRHLCDANVLVACPDALGIHTGFDPRVTPRRWLAATEGEVPEATLDRFVTTTQELLVAVGDGLAEGHRADVRLPYGTMDWTVLLLHAFWDSWIHERDVLLASGRGHPTDDGATAYATAYGVFLAAAVASMQGDPVTLELTLGADGGGVFDLGDGDGVTLQVTRQRTDGPPAAEVADALAGRSPTALRRLPAGSRRALSRLAEFFNAPVA